MLRSVARSYRMTLSAPERKRFRTDITHNLINHITEEESNITRKHGESCYE